MSWKSPFFWMALTLVLSCPALQAQVREPLVFPVFPGDSPKEPTLPPPIGAIPEEAPKPESGSSAAKPLDKADGETKTHNVTASLGFFGDIDLDKTSSTKSRVFVMEGEYLLLSPRGNPSAVAVTGPTSNTGPGSYSNTIFIPGGYESGFRVSGTWLNPERDADLTLKYTYYSWQSDVWGYAPLGGNNYYPYPVAYSGVAPAATSNLVALPQGGLTPTLISPGYAGQVAQVSAKSNILFQFGDLEFGKQFFHDDWLGFRVFAGPRYAYLSQSIQAHYTGGWMNSADYGSKVLFNGGGVRVGGSADATLIGSLGFRFWGSASVVAGSYEGRMNQTINGRNTFAMSETTFGTIPIIDAGIGLNCKGKGWSLLIGYELQSWLNVVQGYTVSNDYFQPKTQRQYGNLGFDGFTGLGVKSEIAW